MNTLSTLTIMPSDKAQIKSFTEKAKNEIVNFTENPLIIWRQLKAIETVVKNLLTDKQVKEAIIDEADKYVEKTFEEYGARFTKMESGVKYDYTVCNDDVWNALNDQLNQLKEAIKVREAVLKAGFDPATGETFTKPAKSSTTTVSVTIL